MLQAFVCTFSKALQAEYKEKGITIQVRLTVLSPWEQALWIYTELGPLSPAGLAVHVQPQEEGGLDDTMGVIGTTVVTAVPPLFHLLPLSPMPWLLEQEMGQGERVLRNSVDFLAT